jgi:hypothetical protein
MGPNHIGVTIEDTAAVVRALSSPSAAISTWPTSRLPNTMSCGGWPHC